MRRFLKSLILFCFIPHCLFSYLESWRVQFELNKYDTLYISPETTSTTPAITYTKIILLGKVVTMDELKNGAIEVIDDGFVAVEGEKIEYVGRISELGKLQIDSTRTIIIPTNGIIFPGLINAHDHIHYNFLPLWDIPKKYTNRYQWGDDKSQVIDIKYWQKIMCGKKYFGLETELVKYAEVK
ncbi:MAG: amidohydrolase family protein, partial [bacterium]